jgi:Uma2 family endonuclease
MEWLNSLVWGTVSANNDPMGKPLTEREFKPGSTGWTVQDLDDPAIERLWEASHYEIVEGVLAEMPPAYFDGHAALTRLIMMVQKHLDRRGIKGDWGSEVDFIVDVARLAKPDAMLLVQDDLKRQAAINAKVGKRGTKYGRIRVAPTLLIESVSMGHETHDRALKRRWYAEFGVRNYWILDAFRKTLECLVLDDRSYKLDVMGRKSEKIRPRAFPGLVIALGKLWV